MAISTEDVEKVAALARLHLSSAETERMVDQLSAILGHIEVLNELDTAHIAPTAQVIAVQNVVRDDAVRPSLPVEQVLANAPVPPQEMCFRIRAVLE